MKEYTENAMQFTMDGGVNAYEFRDEDDNAADGRDYKAMIGVPCFDISLCKATDRGTLLMHQRTCDNCIATHGAGQMLIICHAFLHLHQSSIMQLACTCLSCVLHIKRL